MRSIGAADAPFRHLRAGRSPDCNQTCQLKRPGKSAARRVALSAGGLLFGRRGNSRGAQELDGNSKDQSWSNWIGVVLPPPRSPSPEDGAAMLALAGDVLGRSTPLSVLLLGVTPQIVQLDWPSTVRLLAVDSNPAVANTAWAPSAKIDLRLELAMWDALPVESGSVDLIVGDCSFNALSDFEFYEAVAAECARALAPDGAMVLRFFGPVNPRKTPDQAIADARLCEDNRLSHFRLDLAVAISGGSGFVDALQIRATFDEKEPDRERFAARTGATIEEISRAIDLPAERFPELTLNYFSVEEIGERMKPWFTIDAVYQPHYFKGELCPTLRLLPSGEA